MSVRPIRSGRKHLLASPGLASPKTWPEPPGQAARRPPGRSSEAGKPVPRWTCRSPRAGYNAMSGCGAASGCVAVVPFHPLPQQRLEPGNENRETSQQPSRQYPDRDPGVAQLVPPGQSVDPERSQKTQTEGDPEREPTVVRHVENRQGAQQVVYREKVETRPSLRRRPAQAESRPRSGGPAGRSPEAPARSGWPAPRSLRLIRSGYARRARVPNWAGRDAGCHKQRESRA